MFNEFKSRYILKGTLTLDSGLHIGGGKMIPVTGSDTPVVKDYNGLPYIPGSSFKGVLRSTLEALCRGINNQNDLWSCDLVKDEGCVRLDKKEEMISAWKNDQIQHNIKKTDEQFKEQYEDFIISNSCTICKLFGSPFLGSKVLIKDIQVKPETFSLIEVRDFVTIDRDTETSKYKGKFDAEVVPVKTAFEIEMVVENPEDYELGLLFNLFDMLNSGEIMLGGLTSRGLGRVYINWGEIVKKDAQSFITGKEKIYGPKDEKERQEDMDTIQTLIKLTKTALINKYNNSLKKDGENA